MRRVRPAPAVVLSIREDAAGSARLRPAPFCDGLFLLSEAECASRARSPPQPACAPRNSGHAAMPCPGCGDRCGDPSQRDPRSMFPLDCTNRRMSGQENEVVRTAARLPAAFDPGFRGPPLKREPRAPAPKTARGAARPVRRRHHPPVGNPARGAPRIGASRDPAGAVHSYSRPTGGAPMGRRKCLKCCGYALATGAVTGCAAAQALAVKREAE